MSADSNPIDADVLLGSLKKNKIRMPYEIGTYLALEACECLLRIGPAIIEARDICIRPDGEVLIQPRTASAPDVAARSVVSVLAKLLVAAGGGVPPTLLDLVERAPSDQKWDLLMLRDFLEAQLVPLNRSASKRVLSRLVRETERERPANAIHKSKPPEPQQDALDADLDAFLHGDAAKLAPATVLAAELTPTPIPVPKPVAALDLEEKEPGEPTVESAAFAPKGRSKLFADGVDSFEEGEKGKGIRSWVWMLVFAVLTGALIAGVATLRPDVWARVQGKAQKNAAALQAKEKQLHDAKQKQLLEDHKRKYGDLVVNVIPERAEVFLYVGRGPAHADNIPVGVPHEFVAWTEGHTPTRAVVAADAAWESHSQKGFLYELAMQTGAPISDKASLAFENLDFGPSQMPRVLGQARGLGTVRIITTPPGANVYQLVGFAPDVRVQDIRTDEAHELLIFHQGYVPQKVVVGLSDWVEKEDRNLAEISIVLVPRKPIKRR